MKPTAIVYTSNTGHTRQYALLLGEQIGLPVSQALELCWRVFLEFEVPEYSQEGIVSFLALGIVVFTMQNGMNDFAGNRSIPIVLRLLECNLIIISIPQTSPFFCIGGE